MQQTLSESMCSYGHFLLGIAVTWLLNDATSHKSEPVPSTWNVVIWPWVYMHLSEVWNWVISSFWRINFNFKWPPSNWSLSEDSLSVWKEASTQLSCFPTASLWELLQFSSVQTHPENIFFPYPSINKLLFFIPIAGHFILGCMLFPEQEDILRLDDRLDGKR